MTSQIDLRGTFLGLLIRTSPGSHFETSAGRQIQMSQRHQFGKSPGWSNGIFREHPGEAGGGLLWDISGANICRLEAYFKYIFTEQ